MLKITYFAEVFLVLCTSRNLYFTSQIQHFTQPASITETKQLKKEKDSP